MSLDDSDSSPNRCVEALTRGQSARRWFGQLIGYRAREESGRDLTQFVDVSRKDVSKFTEYFKRGGNPPFAVQWSQRNGMGEMLAAMMAAMMTSERASYAQDSQRPSDDAPNDGDEQSSGQSSPAMHEASQPLGVSRNDLEKIASDVRVAISERFFQERMAIREIVATETKNAMLAAVGMAFAAYASWCLLVLPLVALLGTVLKGIRAMSMLIV
ncbi:hypothetical protein FKP32DRAFT_1682498 [Trametes sanguinea]|nr:hypothetical protein FKP32DRAFT_1682498 [Trametes sanguinea]